ncbi:MAG: peptidoglycan-binding protein [bacterium]|nr:peptidoglycan-binding protein [bacterium]
MNKKLLSLVIIASVCFSTPVFAISVSPVATLPPNGEQQMQLQNFSVPFVQNVGQADKEVKFIAEIYTGAAFVTNNGLTYNVKGDGFTYGFSENIVTKKKLSPVPVSASSTNVSSFLGSDQSKWKSTISAASSVSFGYPWKNIELSLNATNNKVEKIFTVFPKGKTSDIKLSFSDIPKISVNQAGELVLATGHGDLTMSKPIAFQNINNATVPVSVSYKIYNSTTYGFEVGAYNKKYPLIIDPILQATYLGGTGADGSFDWSDLAIGSDGDVFIVSETSSTDYPGRTGGYQSALSTATDIVVSRLSSDLTTLEQSTYLGGTGTEYRPQIVVRQSDNAVFVAGTTSSTDYPGTAGGYQAVKSTGQDYVISLLPSTLTSLTQSTYLGGTGSESFYGIGIALYGSNIFIAGDSTSTNFPGVAGGAQSANAGGSDFVISSLAQTLTTLNQSTYVGGTSSEDTARMTVSSTGSVYLVGTIYSSATFPGTTGGAQATFMGGSGDIIVAKLNTGLTSILQSTYIGGTGYEDYPSVVTNSSGQVYVSAYTNSADILGKTGGAVATIQGDNDQFITLLNSDLTSITQSTYAGGTLNDSQPGLAISATGDLYIAGDSGSTTAQGSSSGFRTTNYGSNDILVSHFDSTLTTLHESTFIGGTGSETRAGFAIDSSGNIYLRGRTTSTDLAGVSGGAQTALSGSNDNFIVKMSSLRPAAVSNVTSSTSNGSYAAGGIVSVQVVFNGIVTVTGTPQLTLETGTTDAVVNYASGSGTTTLTFTYTVAAGQNNSDLDYASTTALALNSGTISDNLSNAALLTLPTPGATGSLGANKALVIDTAAPVLSIYLNPNIVIFNPGNTVTLSGSCESGLTVTVSSSFFSNQTTICSSSAYSVSATMSNVATGSITVSQTDGLGNIGTASSSNIEVANAAAVPLPPSSGASSVPSVVFAAPNLPSPSSYIPAPTPTPSNSCALLLTQTLRYGSRDNRNGITQVKILQKFLINRSISLGTADGIFGTKTKRATVSFQTNSNLSADGIVGPNTRGVINAFCETGF